MSWKVLITARTITEVGARALEILREAGCEVIIPEKLGPLPADIKQAMIDELDAVVACLYGLSADQLRHIFETFHEGWDFAPRLEAVMGHFNSWISA